MNLLQQLAEHPKAPTLTISSALAGTMVDWLPTLTELNQYLQTAAYCVSIIVGVITIIYKIRKRSDS